jgi:hypothetical protein
MCLIAHATPIRDTQHPVATRPVTTAASATMAKGASANSGAANAGGGRCMPERDNA